MLNIVSTGRDSTTAVGYGPYEVKMLRSRDANGKTMRTMVEVLRKGTDREHALVMAIGAHWAIAVSPTRLEDF